MESSTLPPVLANAGARLRKWREIEGLTLEETADRLNVLLDASGFERRADHSRLSRIERGEDTPGLALAACIERLTGIVASSWVKVA